MSRVVIETKTLIRKGQKEDFSLFGAFPDDADLTLTVQSQGLFSALLILHCDGLSSEKGEIYREYNLSYNSTENGSCFSVTLTPDELNSISDKGLFYYKYRLTFEGGTEEYAGEGVKFLTRWEDYGDRQLLMYSHDFKTPDFIRQGMIYHIFVDRFASSGKCALKDGARLNPDWENGIPDFPPYPGARIDNREFFGGDLFGIVEKLDYLESLGVTCIYLSPIFESPSNHKYDTADYDRVDSAFGGDEALEILIKEAKKHGIGIMLDGVFNHTGDDSVYFNKKGNYPAVGAFQSRDSAYYPWYYFEKYPDKYTCWWDIDILPKVNCDCDSYKEYILGDGGIVEKYMKMGVSGFRLDVADELSEDFLAELRKTVRKNNPDGIVLGEVWEDASNKIAYSKRRHYFGGYELDSVMNYPLRTGIIEFVKHGNPLMLKNVTEGLYRRYPKCVSDCLMNFLGTHDTERIITVLCGEPSEGKSNETLSKISLSPEEKSRGIEMLKVAYTILAFMYGVPSVFYGDEAGLEGYRDPFCRKPYPWGRECTELVDFYSSVGTIRQSLPVLSEGLFEVDLAEGGLFAYRRYDKFSTLYVVANAGSEGKTYSLPLNSQIILKTNSGIISKAGKISLPPLSAAVFTF